MIDESDNHSLLIDYLTDQEFLAIMNDSNSPTIETTEDLLQEQYNRSYASTGPSLNNPTTGESIYIPSLPEQEQN